MTKARQIGDSAFSIDADPQTNTLVFSTNSIERMKIDANGNIGIGTSTPTGTLHVDGSITVSENVIQGGVNMKSFAIAMSVALSI